MNELLSSVLEEYARSPLDQHILGQALHSTDAYENYIKGRNTYAWYYAIGKVIQPNTIIEMGVRFGYSAIAFCIGAMNKPDYLGIDNESSFADSNIYAENFIRQVSGECQVLTCEIEEMPRSACADLVHIDLLHDEEQTMEELKSALTITEEHGYIILSGTANAQRKTAANNFCENHEMQFIDIPAHHGIMIIGS